MRFYKEIIGQKDKKTNLNCNLIKELKNLHILRFWKILIYIN